MRRVILIVAFAALVIAKPEMYKEKEDFQFSRSSSDDGNKSGYYGAQRGNMGGNYEKAHNMDNLAQHQMSGLISQVQGELGDASSTKTGTVFTSANSRGIYGNGHYDTSNLQGRNFQDGLTHTDSESAQNYRLSGSHSTSQHNAAYSGSQLEDSRYRTSGRLSHTSLNAGGDYDAAAQEDLNSRAFSQNGYHQQSAYDQSSLNQQRSSSGSNIQSRLVSRTPVRVIIRPGTQVNIPVAAQTYDASQSASSFDQNAVNRETEILSNSNHQTDYMPTSNAKHYESSYKYRKEWEKHSGSPVAVPVPLAIPTENPFGKNGEFNENALGEISENQHRANAIHSQGAHSSNSYSGYNANVKSSSSGRSQSDYNAGYRSTAGSSAHDFAGSDSNFGASAALTNLQAVHPEPKSYSSSYSYHKSWERQGDPYVIKPVGVYDGQTSQRLTSGALNHQGAYSQSHQFGSQRQSQHQSYTHGGVLDCDCDEDGQIRVARSVDQKPVYFDQQNQEQYDVQEELGQQTQTGWDNLEDLGQQSQSSWDDGGQQTQNQWDKFEDLGQQTQNKWDKIEDLGQQTQNQWDKIEDLGQQTQNFGKIPQSFHPSTIERDQQTQDNLNTFNQNDQQNINLVNGVKPLKEVISDVNEQNQNSQQIQSTWNKLGSFDVHQTEENKTLLEKHIDTVPTLSIKNTWDKIDSLDVYHDSQVDKESKNYDLFSLDSIKKHSPNANTWDKLDSAFYLNPEKVNNGGNNKQKQLNTQNENTFDKENDQHNIYIISQNKTTNDNNKVTEQNKEKQSKGNDNQGEQTNYKDFNEQEFWSLIHELEQQSKENLNQDSKAAENGVLKTNVYRFSESEGIDKNIWDHIHQLEQQSKYNQFQESQSSVGDVYTTYHHMYYNDKNIWDFINQLEQQYKENSKDQENDTHWNKNGNNIYSSYGNHGYSNDFLNSNHDLDSNTQNTNLNNLFEKIHNMEKQYSKFNLSDNNFNVNMNENVYTNYQDPTSTHNFYHQTYYSDLSTSNSAPNPYQPHNQPSFDKYYPHHKFSNNGSLNTTDVKAYNGIQTSIVNNTTRPIESVNIKADTNRGDIYEPESSEDLRPQDVGRGDIGAEDSVIKTPSTTEHKTNVTESSYRYHFTSSDLPNSYKTPEEIETLSLTKNITQTKPINNENITNTNKENSQEAESDLSVLSISQQKLLEEERQHASRQFYKPSHLSSTTKPNITYSSPVINENSNKYFIPNVSSDNKNTTQNIGGLSEQPVDTEQQNMDQYFEHFDFGQQNENLDQQSDIQWGQNQDNLGQEVQTSWNTNENFQQETQQFENNSSYENFNQKQDFYQGKYPTQTLDNVENNQKETALKKKVEVEIPTPLEPLDFGQESENFDQQSDIQWEKNPESNIQTQNLHENLNQHEQDEDINSFDQSQNFYQQKYLLEKKDNTENIQRESLEQKKVEAEILSPAVVTTEKPGFWKSVGNKFSNAKDKVTSWFGRSR